MALGRRGDAACAGPLRLVAGAGAVSHTFTHFRLEMMVYRAVVPVDTPLNLWAEPERCRWVKRRSLAGEALPSVMKKLVGHALKEV